MCYMFILLSTLIITIYGQFATLSYPSSINSGRIVCGSHAAGATTTYTPTFSPYVFGANPILALGISQMSITPTLTIDFSCITTAISTTGFTLSITLGAATTTSIPLISFHYLGIHQTNYNTAGYSPFYTSEMIWAGMILSPIALTTGQRSLQLRFDRIFTAPLLINDYAHNMQCSPMLMGITGTTTDNEYSIENSCYCTTGLTCCLKVVVRKNTKITMLRIRFVMVDGFMMENAHMVAVEMWNQVFANGTAVGLIPMGYLYTNTATFTGLHSLTTSSLPSQSFDIVYLSGVFTVPLTYTAGFHHYFITQTSCPSTSISTTATHKCFTGYNGCPLTTFQTFPLFRTVYQQRISPTTNKYILICHIQGLDIYKNTGTTYQLYQSINKRWGCRNIATNKDFSIIAIMRASHTTNPTFQFIEVYVFSAVRMQWEYRAGIDGDMNSISAGLAMSENGQTIMLSVAVVTSPFYVGYLRQYEFNTTQQKYVLVSDQTIPGSIARMTILTDPITGLMRLVMVMTDGFKVVQKKKLYKSGKFHHFSSQPLPLATLPYFQSSRTVWSLDTKVLAILGQPEFTKISIYHFNQTTQLYQKHSQAKSFLTVSSQLFMDHEGLAMTAYGKDGFGYLMVLYRRTTLSGEFQVVAMERAYSTGVSSTGFDFTKEVIIVSDLTSLATSSIKVYYCGPSVIGSVQPLDGHSIMSTIITQDQISLTDLQLQTLTNSTLSLQSNLSLLTNHTQNLTTKTIVLETLINSTSPGSLQQIQQLTTELNQAQQSREKDTVMFIVLFVVIGLQMVVLVGLVYKVVRGKQRSGDNGSSNKSRELVQSENNSVIQDTSKENITLQNLQESTQPQPFHTKAQLQTISNTTSTLPQPPANQLSLLAMQYEQPSYLMEQQNPALKSRKRRQRLGGSGNNNTNSNSNNNGNNNKAEEPTKVVYVENLESPVMQRANEERRGSG